MSEWSILVSLLSDCDEDIVVDSTLLPLESTQDDCFYAWTDALALDGFDMDLQLSFQLVLGCGRLEVFRISIPKTSISVRGYMPRKLDRRKSIYGTTESLDDQHDVLKIKGVNIHYAAHRYNVLYQIRIYMVSLTLPAEYIRRVVYQRGHKLGLFVTTEKDVEVYLGRPQRIRTDDGNRHYMWIASNDSEQNFGTLSPRSNLDFIADEEKDKILIRTHYKNKAEVLLSTRRIRHDANVIWDNDAFANPNKRLPILAKNLTLHFYNFKNVPPRSIKCIITWSQFSSAYLANLNRLEPEVLPVPKQLFVKPDPVEVPSVITCVLIPELSVWIRFYIDMERQLARITHIHLHATKYKESLDFVVVQ